MNLYIRDDDTSYFTKKEELDFAFSEIWKYGPVNLAVIPFSVYTENHGLQNSYKQIPSKEYFIGDNKELVTYLKRLIKENKVQIMLHGFNHYYLPSSEKKYPFGIPEFIFSNNQREKIELGKNALENLFEIEIRWFIPPSNALTRHTIDICDQLNLNVPLLLNLKNRLPEILYQSPLALINNRLNKVNGNNVPLKFKNHLEISCVSYTTQTDFKSDYVRNTYNKVLSTHYWELNKNQHIKERVIEDIKQYGGIINGMNDIA